MPTYNGVAAADDTGLDPEFSDGSGQLLHCGVVFSGVARVPETVRDLLVFNLEAVFLAHDCYYATTAVRIRRI
jgi:hypothetical protein